MQKQVLVFASSATKNNDLDQELSTEFGHIPKTEKEVMEGEEQNLDNKYERLR